MPVYNSGEYLKTAVESILSQSLKEFELILVDDGSTDGSSDQCDEYARKDERVVVIHQKNGGICAARNAALKVARGEYIAFSDHDDEYLPGLLEDNYNMCIEYQLDFVKFCKITIELLDNKVIKRENNYVEQRVYERKDVIANIVRLTERRLGSCVWDTMFYHKFLKEHQILFDPYFKMGGEDYAFIYQCMQHVTRFGTNDKVYYVHNIRKNYSTSSKFNPQCMEVQRRMPQNMINLLNAYSLDPYDIKDDYAFFYTMFYLTSQLQNIMKVYPKSEWNKQAALLKKEPFFYDFINYAHFSFRRNKKYNILHYLFRFNLYCVIFFIYKYLKNNG